MRYGQVMVFIFCMQNGYPQVSSNCFNSQLGVLSRAPKSWFSYIRNLLHLSHKKQGMTKEKYRIVLIRDILKSLTSRFKPFINYSQFKYGERDMDNNTAEAKDKFQYECRNPLNFECWIKFYKNITKALSQFDVFHVVERPGLYLIKRFRVKTIIKYTWTFNIHPTLRLHVKFWEIHFLVIEENPCYGGTIKFENFNLTFCGVHAQVSVFSQSSSTSLLLLSFIHTYYKVHFLQYVSDENLLHSFTLTPIIEFEPGLIFPQVSLFMIIFRLKVQKFERITLKVDRNISVNKFVIYDGPGPKAERVSGISHVVEGTAFQRTIQVCGNIFHFANGFASNRLNFNYKSNTLIQAKTFAINTDEILTVECIPHYDRMIPVVMNIFSFHASKSHHINATITDYFYEGLDSSGCSYGGLAAFEMIKDINYEIRSLCNKMANLLTQHRNIYSTDEKLLVAVYSYKSYSKIRVQ